MVAAISKMRHCTSESFWWQPKKYCCLETTRRLWLNEKIGTNKLPQGRFEAMDAYRIAWQRNVYASLSDGREMTRALRCAQYFKGFGC